MRRGGAADRISTARSERGTRCCLVRGQNRPATNRVAELTQAITNLSFAAPLPQKELQYLHLKFYTLLLGGVVYAMERTVGGARCAFARRGNVIERQRGRRYCTSAGPQGGPAVSCLPPSMAALGLALAAAMLGASPALADGGTGFIGNDGSDGAGCGGLCGGGAGGGMAEGAPAVV